MGVALRPGSNPRDWTIAFACLDGTVGVWRGGTDVSTPSLQHLRGHSAGVNAVTFLSDKHVASGADDGTVQVSQSVPSTLAQNT